MILNDVWLTVLNKIINFSLHTGVREEEIINSSALQKRLVYEHKIKSGITNIKNYGLSLAAKTNLPAGTIQLAWELAELIDKKRNVIKTYLNNHNIEYIYLVILGK